MAASRQGAGQAPGRKEEKRARGARGKERGEEEAPQRPPLDLQLRAALLSCAGLILPGLGHVVVGRVGRGLVLFAAIATMLGLGLANQGGLATPRPGEPLTYLATFGNLGLGPAYYLLRSLGFGIGNPDHPTYEYGTTFILSAGLLNFLLVLDAYDIAVGNRK